MVTTVSLSALMASTGMLFGPAALPFLSVVIAFLISVLDGLSQLMGSTVSAGGMSGGVLGAGRFNNYLKCSALAVPRLMSVDRRPCL
jgi:hypothetical protein